MKDYYQVARVVDELFSSEDTFIKDLARFIEVYSPKDKSKYPLLASSMIFRGMLSQNCAQPASNASASNPSSLTQDDIVQYNKKVLEISTKYEKIIEGHKEFFQRSEKAAELKKAAKEFIEKYNGIQEERERNLELIDKKNILEEKMQAFFASEKFKEFFTSNTAIIFTILTYDEDQKFFTTGTKAREIADYLKGNAKENLDICSYLIKPLQRILKYRLLIESCLKEFTDPKPEYLTSAQKTLQALSNQANEAQRKQEEYSQHSSKIEKEYTFTDIQNKEAVSRILSGLKNNDTYRVEANNGKNKDQQSKKIIFSEDISIVIGITENKLTIKLNCQLKDLNLGQMYAFLLLNQFIKDTSSFPAWLKSGKDYHLKNIYMPACNNFLNADQFKEKMEFLKFYSELFPASRVCEDYVFLCALSEFFKIEENRRLFELTKLLPNYKAELPLEHLREYFQPSNKKDLKTILSLKELQQQLNTALASYKQGSTEYAYLQQKLDMANKFYKEKEQELAEEFKLQLNSDLDKIFQFLDRESALVLATKEVTSIIKKDELPTKKQMDDLERALQEATKENKDNQSKYVQEANKVLNSCRVLHDGLFLQAFMRSQTSMALKLTNNTLTSFLQPHTRLLPPLSSSTVKAQAQPVSVPDESVYLEAWSAPQEQPPSSKNQAPPQVIQPEAAEKTLQEFLQQLVSNHKDKKIADIKKDIGDPLQQRKESVDKKLKALEDIFKGLEKATSCCSSYWTKDQKKHIKFLKIAYELLVENNSKQQGILDMAKASKLVNEHRNRGLWAIGKTATRKHINKLKDIA